MLATREVPRPVQESKDRGPTKYGKNTCSIPDTGSYRPIALLPTLAKVIESVVANKVTRAAEANGLLPDEQMGNRAHRSAELAVRLVVVQVQEAWKHLSRSPQKL